MKYAILLAMLMGTQSGDQLHVSTEPLPLHPKAPCVRENGTCRPLRAEDFQPGSHAVIENMEVVNLKVRTLAPQTWIETHGMPILFTAYFALTCTLIFLINRYERWKILRKARGLGMVRP